MNFLRLLIKPKWQHKDAAVRRAAVAETAELELTAALPTILRADADAGVRLAALRRLDDYELWRERSTADADAGLRSTARAVYLQRLMGGSAGVPALERRIAELDTLSAEELELLTSGAADTALRAAALERVKRPSLLIERALADPDPALRLAALERIHDPDALGRVAERARKSDKTVSRLAREKQEALRIAAGDAEAIAARGRQLCDRAEALLQRPRGERVAELAAIDAAWQPLVARVPDALRERLVATLAFLHSDTDEAAAQRERLRQARARIGALLPQLDTVSPGAIEPVLAEAGAALAAAPQELPERQPVEDGVGRLMQRLAALAAQGAEPVAAAVEPAGVPGSADAVAAQARFDASVAAVHETTRRERERQAALRQQLDAEVIELEGLLERGDIGAAHAVYARIDAALPDLPAIVQHERRLTQAQARYAELKRWQHWSNNEQRKRLCDAVEALAGSGLHPDAVATRVREARSQWQALDRSEGIAAPAAGERPGGGLARRFQALCNQALKPTRGYFEKRSELRKSHEQDIAALVDRAAAVADDQADRQTWATLRGDVVIALRGLDKVDPRQRKHLAQQLKDVLARIDARLGALDGATAEAKRALIARAERAAQQSDRLAAARELRGLQKQWKETGSGRRREDEALWQAFRAVCDRVFGELDAQRTERDQRDAKLRSDAGELLDALDALAGTADEGLPARRRELEARWAELDVRDRELESRWRRGIARLDDARESQQRRERHAVFDAARERLALCERSEQDGPSEDSRAQWASLPEVGGELGMALQARFDAASAGAPTQLADSGLDAAREILVQLEFHGGCETPAEDRQRRMDWQVARLSDRLRGTGAAPRQELLDLSVRWVSLGGLRGDDAPALRQRFDAAYRAAVERLP